MSKRPFLERMTVVGSHDRVLEALYQRGKSGAPVLLAPNHQSRGAMMDHAAFAELCFGLCAADHSTLRFNYGGVGASSAGEEMAGEARDHEDLLAAHQHLRETEERRCMLVAHGYACRLFHSVEKMFSRIALIDPEPDDLGAWLEGEQSTETQIFVSEHAPHREALGEMLSEVPLTVIANASPGFERGLPQLRSAVVGFFGK